MTQQSHEELRREHEPHAIRERLRRPFRRQYLSDAVLGGIDGCVTTFAIVAASVGAGFPTHIAVVLGFANLIADGVSMAVSNYESTQLQRELRERARRTEERHIDQVPEGEREEVRQIYRDKGFEGETLERIVEGITADRERWIETMLSEELGLEKAVADPKRSAAATFFAFVSVGAIPLMPLLVPALEPMTQFAVATVLAGLVFLAIGGLKAVVLGLPVARAALATLGTGGVAAGLAFAVGYGLEIGYVAAG